MPDRGITKKRSSSLFDELVVFCDELSDNGNGSYAHGITGSPPNMYGFGTWTDGPVAVSYSADLFNVPLTDRNSDGCCGGVSFRATVNNTYNKSPAKYDGQPVPSAHDHVVCKYAVSNPLNVIESSESIVAGENNSSEHTNPYDGDPQNAASPSSISDRIIYNAEDLIETGAPCVCRSQRLPEA